MQGRWQGGGLQEAAGGLQRDAAVLRVCLGTGGGGGVVIGLVAVVAVVVMADGLLLVVVLAAATVVMAGDGVRWWGQRCGWGDVPMC